MIGCPPPPSMKKTSGARAIEDRLILGPAAGDEDRLDARHLGQALGQQLAAGVELVVARPVAGPAGDQDDLGRVGGPGGSRKRPRTMQSRNGERELLPHD